MARERAEEVLTVQVCVFTSVEYVREPEEAEGKEEGELSMPNADGQRKRLEELQCPARCFFEWVLI